MVETFDLLLKNPLEASDIWNSIESDLATDSADTVAANCEFDADAGGDDSANNPDRQVCICIVHGVWGQMSGGKLFDQTPPLPTQRKLHSPRGGKRRDGHGHEIKIHPASSKMVPTVSTHIRLQEIFRITADNANAHAKQHPLRSQD